MAVEDIRAAAKREGIENPAADALLGWHERLGRGEAMTAQDVTMLRAALEYAAGMIVGLAMRLPPGHPQRKV